MPNRKRRGLLAGALLSAPLGLMPLIMKHGQAPALTVHAAIRYLNREVFKVAHERHGDEAGHAKT